MGAAASHSNKTVAFNELDCSLFIILSYYLDDLSNFIYIFNYLYKLFADHRPPQSYTIHSTKVLSDTLCIFGGYFKNV